MLSWTTDKKIYSKALVVQQTLFVPFNFKSGGGRQELCEGETTSN